MKDLTRVMFESDSAIVVDLMLKGCPRNHPCEAIITCINRLKMQDWEVSFQHTYRQVNQVANWIASYALTIPTGIHILHIPPPCCISLLWQDSAGVPFSRGVPL
jgi:hypothetical protein